MKSKNICKFCGQEKKLIKAHIIPRNFYLDYKNEQYMEVNALSGKFTIKQSGSYDKNILCSDCDNLLGEFDKEAHRVLIREINNNLIHQAQNYTLYYCKPTNYNYEKLRKFFISVLWRASISALPEYDKIQLGDYEEVAFKILKNQETFKDLFKIFVFKFPNGLDYNKWMYMSQTKILGRKAYVICMAGYLINIILNGKNLPDNTVFKEMFVTEKGFYILESLDLYKRHYNNASQKMNEMWLKGFKPPFKSKYMK